MKFTLSWLKDHLETEATVAEVADAMTMAGLEVEHVADPAAKLAPFSVARIVEAVQHPNADRLRVCQVDTVDGRKEIVCGAPNARAGLTTIYAPIGAYVPGLGVTLVEKPVRGVVSNGMLCSGAELEVATEADGILDLDESLAVGTPAAQVFGAEPVIDFEVTPNRPDWLGVVGIARDLSATDAAVADEAPDPPDSVTPLIGDDATSRHIVQLFIETAPGQVERLRHAVATGDITTASTTAHALRGAMSHFSGAALDALEAVDLAAERGQSAEDVAPLAARAASDVEAMIEGLRRLQ